jgi:signal transduction histidine kinase
MASLKPFLNRYILWIGLIAVVVPLVIILVLQYWSLVKLEKTLPVAGQASLRNYLSGVSTEIQNFYQTGTRDVLNVPSRDFTQNRLSEVGYHHFKRKKAPEAKRLFVTGFSHPESEVLFYNPTDYSMQAFPDSPETRVVNVACAPWRLLSKQETTMEPEKIFGVIIDQDNRILLNPIIDGSSRLVGVAGMIVDVAFFKNEYLPRVVHSSLSHFFSEHEQGNLIVAAYDCCSRLVLGSQPAQGQDDEVSQALPFIFRDWHMGIRSRYLTHEQWARRYFAINLSLSILMTLVLIGGIVLALRTASREIRLSQMKTDFVSNVSHELRTPLSSIRVFGEFLKLGRVQEPEKVSLYGEYIETESRRLTQLINNILDFSKIESGRKTYQFEKASVEQTVAEILRIFEVRLKQSDFSIIFEPPQKPLPLVTIDQDAVARALMNLLDNAIKYSGAAREILIRVEEQNRYITLSVTDHGIGIPPAEQEKIFERFHRVSAGLVHDVKGSGLGLALVKHIVEAHGGKVTVDSTLGKGSSFTIYLPLDPLRPGAEQQKSSALVQGDASVGMKV